MAIKSGEMIDRVARKLAECGLYEPYDEVPVDEVFRRPRYVFLAERYREIALVLITEMRRPTAAMIEAGWKDGNCGYGEGEEMEPIWLSMIDCALNGG